MLDPEIINKRASTEIRMKSENEMVIQEEESRNEIIPES